MILDFCCICGTTDNLHNHHIVPVSKGGSEEENNMITLCTKHHAWIHGLKPTTWNNHAKLVLEGQQRARDKGKHIGRPSNITDEKIEDIRYMREEEYPPYGIRRIARTLGIGVSTVYKVMEQELIR